MKRKSVLFLLLMAMFMPLAMHAQGLMKAPDVSLQAVPSQELTTQITQPAREAGWLQYDDDNYVGGIGNSSAMEWTWGVMFPSNMLGDNNTLTKVSMHESPSHNTGDITINIYSGGVSAPSTLLYTETVTPTGSEGMHEVTLAQEVTFDPTQNLWITLTETGTFVMHYSQMSNPDPNGQWVQYQGTWYNIGALNSQFAGDVWLIRGFVKYVGAGITCSRPTFLSADRITKTSAVLSWNSDARAWQICVNGDEANAIDVTQNPYTITGLNPETDYTVKVRANCGSDGYSEWTGNVSFTTLEACPDITDLTASNVTTNSAMIDWTGDNDSYDLRYGVIPNAKDPIVGDNGWYYYDNGDYGTSIGLGEGSSFSWGVMFPAGTYLGDILYKVSAYDVKAMTGNVTIYNDGDTAPTDPIGSVDVTFTGAEEFVEFDFHQLSIDPTKNLWVVFYNESGTDYPAAASEDETNDSNGRWVEINGGWYDVADSGVPGYSWMIRAQIGYDTSSVSWTTLTGINNPYELTGLAPGTTYAVQVRANCGDGTYTDWATTYFKTVSLCSAPTDLDVTNLSATGATLNWTGYQNSYNVRWRTTEKENPIFFEDFEDGLPQTWTTIDSDGDGYNWGWSNSFAAYSGSGLATSASYINDVGALEPDNWLISPQLDLQGTLKVWMRGQNSGSFYAEHFAILLSTTGKQIADFTITLYEGETTDEYQQFTASLRDYNGQQGYIAIRHYNVTDMYYLNVDDFGIYGEPIPAGTWVEETVTTNTHAINGLIPETEYEWQVQGDCPSGTTDWSEMASFTTLPTCPAPTNLAVSNVTANGADLKWSSDAASFDIELDDGSNVVVIEGVTETRYMLPNLEPATIYSVRVRANCGGGDYSHWTEPVEFLTECGGAKDLPYSYDFENIGDYLACWEAYTGNSENSVELDYDPYDNSNIVFSFSSYNEIEDEENESYAQILISPELNATTPVSVHFDYMPYWYYPEYGVVESFLVGYSTETNSISDFEWVGYYEATNDEDWTTYSNIFPEGTKYVAIYYYSEYQYYLYLDNFRFDVPKTFVTDGNWNEANNWSPAGVPTIEDNVIIAADAIIPADYVAEVDVISLDEEDGSITIEDGGQLYQSTYGLKVTMKKNVTAYTGTTDNYQLLASPFLELYTSPEDLTSAEGNDFYKFDNSQPGEEWQNNKQVEIEELYIDEGYLYANPEGIELSLTGSTMSSNVYDEGYLNYESIYLGYDDTENEVNGWYLKGNPFIVDAYIYNVIFDEEGYIEDIIPMNVMYYDENGDMQTIEGGPIAPMQGFFVSVTEDVEAYIFPYDFLNAKNKTSLKNFKKNIHRVSVPDVKLPNINVEKSSTMFIKPMPAKTKAVNIEKKTVKSMSIKK